MADNELYEKLCNGVVFVKVDKVQLYNKLTIDHSMLHVATKTLMNTFYNNYVLKGLDDRSNTMQKHASGCISYHL